jgi:hypothetical protein
MAYFLQSGPTAEAAEGASSISASSLAPVDSWDTFAADVTIRRSLVSADGAPVGVATPAVQYHWERTQNGAGWKTIMTLASVDPATVQSLTGAVRLSNSSPVTRIEDDEDGTPLRMFDRQGGLFRMPASEEMFPIGAAAAPGRSGLQPLADPNESSRPAANLGREWIDRLIAMPSRQADRRQALENQLGKSLERVRGLDRFVIIKGDETREILADPKSALPIEINLVRNGVLVMQTTFTYEQALGKSQIRRASHTEQLASLGTGERTVTDVELTNVRLERRNGGAR